MKNLFRLILISFFILLAAQITKAEDYKVLVLPDNIDFSSTNYLIYPDSSVIFASDTINELKKSGKIETVSMTEVRDALRKNTKLNILTKKALKEFKYNYNIPFVDFKAIAHCFSTDKILVITSQTDVQNYFLRRTIWDALNIPGCTVVDPAYKLSTYAALIDVDKELVIWENTYYKNIASMENRMLAHSFAPATEQLQKLKFYSTYFLSPEIAGIIENKIIPPPLLTPEGQNIINVSNTKTSKEKIAPIEDDLEIKNKRISPTKTNQTNYGMIINDL